jgi:hypothetical protein
MKKSAFVLLIFLAALALWIPSRWKLLDTRRALLQSEARLAQLRGRLAADEATLDLARRARDTQNKARAQALAAVSQSQEAAAKLDPESRWANPPASLPDWNSQSPYIWVPKDFLPRLQPLVFEKYGGMTREAASVLALDDPARRALDNQLRQALADYHALQVSNAQTSDQSLPDANADGPVVTVQIPAMPEEGTAFLDQIQQILQQNLGAQRAGLVTNAAADWLDNLSGQRPTVVSVTRHPDGNWGVCIRSANGSQTSSSGIPSSYAATMLPDYLLPLFADILPPPDDAP